MSFTNKYLGSGAILCLYNHTLAEKGYFQICISCSPKTKKNSLALYPYPTFVILTTSMDSIPKVKGHKLSFGFVTFDLFWQLAIRMW